MENGKSEGNKSESKHEEDNVKKIGKKRKESKDEEDNVKKAENKQKEYKDEDHSVKKTEKKRKESKDEAENAKKIKKDLSQSKVDGQKAMCRQLFGRSSFTDQISTTDNHIPTASTRGTSPNGMESSYHDLETPKQLRVRQEREIQNIQGKLRRSEMEVRRLKDENDALKQECATLHRMLKERDEAETQGTTSSHCTCRLPFNLFFKY